MFSRFVIASFFIASTSVVAMEKAPASKTAPTMKKKYSLLIDGKIKTKKLLQSHSNKSTLGNSIMNQPMYPHETIEAYHDKAMDRIHAAKWHCNYMDRQALNPLLGYQHYPSPDVAESLDPDYAVDKLMRYANVILKLHEKQDTNLDLKRQRMHASVVAYEVQAAQEMIKFFLTNCKSQETMNLVRNLQAFTDNSLYLHHPPFISPLLLKAIDTIESKNNTTTTSHQTNSDEIVDVGSHLDELPLSSHPSLNFSAWESNDKHMSNNSKE